MPTSVGRKRSTSFIRVCACRFVSLFYLLFFCVSRFCSANLVFFSLWYSLLLFFAVLTPILCAPTCVDYCQPASWGEACEQRLKNRRTCLSLLAHKLVSFISWARMCLYIASCSKAAFGTFFFFLLGVHCTVFVFLVVLQRLLMHLLPFFLFRTCVIVFLSLLTFIVPFFFFTHSWSPTGGKACFFFFKYPFEKKKKKRSAFFEHCRGSFQTRSLCLSLRFFFSFKSCRLQESTWVRIILSKLGFSCICTCA